MRMYCVPLWGDRHAFGLPIRMQAAARLMSAYLQWTNMSLEVKVH